LVSGSEKTTRNGAEGANRVRYDRLPEGHSWECRGRLCRADWPGDPVGRDPPTHCWHRRVPRSVEAEGTPARSRS
jgi:hypothetical protein